MLSSPPSAPKATRAQAVARYAWSLLALILLGGSGFGLYRAARSQPNASSPPPPGLMLPAASPAIVARPLPSLLGPTVTVVNPNLWGFANSDSTVLVAGSDGTVLRSLDFGRTFTAAETRVGVSLNAIAYSPEARVWLAVGNHGALLRSEDGGATFATLDVGTKENLNAVAALPHSRRFLVAGDGGTLLESLDGGLSFRPIDTESRGQYLAAAVSPSGGSGYVAGELGQLLATAQAGDFRRLALGTQANLTAVLALDDNTVLVGLDDGNLLRSGDGGSTFQIVSSTDGAHVVVSLAMGRDETTVAAVTARGRVLFSQDRGKSFSVWDTGKEHRFVAITRGASPQEFFAIGNEGLVAALDPWRQQLRRLELDATANVLGVLVTPNRGVLISGQGGLIAHCEPTATTCTVTRPGLPEYVRAAAVAPRTQTIVAVGKSTRALRSTDGGRSFAPLSLPLPADLTLLSIVAEPRSQALIAAGTGGALLRSLDDGLTWQRLEGNTDSISGLFAPGDGSVWAYPYGKPLLCSLDGGEHWQPRSLGTSAIVTMMARGTKPGTLLAAGLNSQLFRSSDDGLHWQRVGLELPGLELQALERDPRGKRLWLAGNRGALFVSDDDGAHFQRVDTRTEVTLNGFAFPPQSDRVLVLGNDGRLLLSDDRGKAFTPIELGLTGHLRFAVTHPETQELWLGGTQGALLQSTDGLRYEARFAHTLARFNQALWHAPTRSILFIGDRLLRLTP